MRETLSKLYKASFLTPAGLYRLGSSFLHSGFNLMGLLRYAARQHPHRIAVVDEHETISYKILHKQAEQLAAALQHNYAITTRKKVAVMCCNHASTVRSIFALSRLGSHVYLLNTEMSNSQFAELNNRLHFDVVIYDPSNATITELVLTNQQCIPSYHATAISIDILSKTLQNNKPSRCKAGKITVLTGGTTGSFKTAERRQSATNFAAPFLALVDNLNLNTFSTVYIATPIYHGFGLAALCMSVALGTNMYLMQNFDAKKAARLISEQQIEAVTVVPLMLSRMLAADAGSLKSLKCIISGGAALNPALVQETLTKLGPVLYNLYGTSEAGFCMLATPQDLAYSAKTIGKAINGVQLRLLDNEHKEVPANSVGQICIQSRWTMQTGSSPWIETGDLAFKDENGYYFLCGKTDDMIVSGGENVYPIELENLLMQHPHIAANAVIGINDDDFGQRLKAFVVPKADCSIAENELLQWLSAKAARYQMPKQIVIVNELPYTSLGKPDKKQLS